MQPLIKEVVATMTLGQIALEIERRWTERHKPADVYMYPMQTLTKLNQSYGEDQGGMVVAYWLSNATRWKGLDARIIKAELNARLNKYYKNDKTV